MKKPLKVTLVKLMSAAKFGNVPVSKVIKDKTKKKRPKYKESFDTEIGN